MITWFEQLRSFLACRNFTRQVSGQVRKIGIVCCQCSTAVLTLL